MSFESTVVVVMRQKLAENMLKMSYSRYPLVHVMVRNAEDIRTAILFARRHNLRVTIKSSGSDFLGRSSAYSSFSINLMLMNDMEVNNRTTPRSEHGEIKVQSGATWSEIFKEVY